MRTPGRGVAVVRDGDRFLVIKRYLKHPLITDCIRCEAAGRRAGDCPGHRYAVLPGGGIEPGENAREAAERELTEETTLVGTAGELLWVGSHFGRTASYFLMHDVRGEPQLSGDESVAHSPTNSFVLAWAKPEEFDDLALFPPEAAGWLDVTSPAG
jgi:ADP-ribose pyrophosphatase YjhB (NUDIX family)